MRARCKAVLAALFATSLTLLCAQHSDRRQHAGRVSSSGSFTNHGGFVTRQGAQLKLDGSPFYFAGGNFYSAMVNAAGGSQTRRQTIRIFEIMQELGLNVLRTWAFNDYGVDNTWQALQTSPGVFSESVFRDGLDWIISEAPKFGVKLLLTLTNYQLGYGGAYQYVKWANGSSISEFYTDPVVQRWYQNNVKTIVTRRNSITGMEYRDDPAIFGWELINEPHVLGDDSGSILNRWIEENSAFLKRLDTKHLVGVGVEGFFGRSTPDRLPDNPSLGLSAWTNGGNPAPYAGICEGQDFTANHRPQGIDFTSLHIYPDFWVAGNLSSQLAFTTQFISSHVRESQLLDKPLIIGEFGKYPPLADRNAFLRTVYGAAAESASSGGALAGTMVWSLGTSPEFPYASGFDAFNVYADRAAYTQPTPSGYIPPLRNAERMARDAEFYGWSNYTSCIARHATNPRGLPKGTTDPSEGWQETIAVIQEAVRVAAEATTPAKPRLTKSTTRSN